MPPFTPLARAALRAAPRRALPRARTLQTSACVRSGSTMHNQDPETLEREKQKNLKGEQDDRSAPMDKAPGWNQHLASRSEAEVKADQESGSPEDLQKETAAKAQEEKR